MRISEINPHIRFAEQIEYRAVGKPVFIKDCRLVYILSGIGAIITGGHQYHISENSLFFCREKSIYTILADKLTLLALDFDLTQQNAEQIEAMPPVPVNIENVILPSRTEIFTDCAFINEHICIENGKRYLNTINRILIEFKQRKMYFRESASAALKSLLIELARKQTLPTENSADALAQTLEYINANFEKDIKNTSLAKMVGYHPYHLNRLFLKYTGQSIHQYILTRRISEAKNLLLSSSLTLSDIAERVGFNSSAHFSAYFKQIVGFSPYQYRVKFKNGI